MPLPSVSRWFGDDEILPQTLGVSMATEQDVMVTGCAVNGRFRRHLNSVIRRKEPSEVSKSVTRGDEFPHSL